MRAPSREWHWQSIAELSSAIRSGAITPVKLTQQLLDRVEALDGTLHAFKLVKRERALAEAEAATWALRAGQDVGPLHGIPYAAKDLFDVKGLPTAAGSPLLEGNVADSDATVVRRLAQHGMILLGKTHTVQFAYGAVGINHHHGTPRNPWCREPHVPGGSSSGSSVAVAAGMVPVALGTDTGGSVRIPAALCGTVGLKTTIGQVSRAGVFPLSWSLDTVGVLARTVEDAALLYQAIQGTDSRDASTVGTHPEDVVSQLKAGVKGLRLAFPEAFFLESAEPEVVQAIHACRDVFRDLGASVTELDFPEAAEAHALNARGSIIAAEAYLIHRDRIEKHLDKYDPIVSQRIMAGKGVTATEHIEKTRAWTELRERAAHTLRDYDACIVPTTIKPAVPITSADASPETYVATNLTYLRNTALGNILDLCGLSIPCSFTKEGLPIGLMIYGKPVHEGHVLRIGYAYERATEWHLRRPPA